MFSFFGLAVAAAIIMFGMRRYRASNRGRNGNGPGGFPGQPFGGSGGFPGQQDNQPRDGFTQRDYYGGFGQLGAPQPPAKQQYQVPYEDSPEYLNSPPQAAAPQAPAGSRRLPRRRRRSRRVSARASSPSWTRSTATASWPWRITWPSARRS